MAKFTKFSIAPDGRLVYRNTGNVVPLKNGYTIKGTTVYNKQGRKVGQLGKGTKTQQKNIKKKSETRVKKAKNKAIRDTLKEFDDEIVHFYTKKKWAGYMDEYHKYAGMDLEHRLKVTRRETSKQNFAMALDDLVKGGSITPDQANDLWDAYNECETEQDEKDLWETVGKEYAPKGWKYKSEPKKT